MSLCASHSVVCWGSTNPISALPAGFLLGSDNRGRWRETERLEEEETCSLLCASCLLWFLLYERFLTKRKLDLVCGFRNISRAGWIVPSQGPQARDPNSEVSPSSMRHLFQTRHLSSTWSSQDWVSAPQGLSSKCLCFSNCNLLTLFPQPRGN